MAKGYPSRKRVRKAFERGIKAARTGRGMNPYKNEVLKNLFERGRNRVGGLTPMRPGAATVGGSSLGSTRSASRSGASGASRQAPLRQPADPQAAAWDRAVRNSLRRRV
jgi:hypothetical protein